MFKRNVRVCVCTEERYADYEMNEACSIVCLVPSGFLLCVQDTECKWLGEMQQPLQQWSTQTPEIMFLYVFYFSLFISIRNKSQRS